MVPEPPPDELPEVASPPPPPVVADVSPVVDVVLLPLLLHAESTSAATAARAVRPTARVFFMNNPPCDGVRTPLVGHPLANQPLGANCATYVSDLSTLRAVSRSSGTDSGNRDRRLTTAS